MKESSKITRSGQHPKAASLNESQGRSSIRKNTGFSCRSYTAHCPEGAFVEQRQNKSNWNNVTATRTTFPRFVPCILNAFAATSRVLPLSPYSPRLIPILTYWRVTTVMRQITGRETRFVCLLTPFFSIRDKCQPYFESSFIVTLTISLTLTREIGLRCITCDLLTICTLRFLDKLHFLLPLYCRFYYYCYFSFRNLFCNCYLLLVQFFACEVLYYFYQVLNYLLFFLILLLLPQISF